MPRVLNKRIDKIPPNAVYVGRPSKWGNPFKLPSFYHNQDRRTKEVLRLSVISQYRRYMQEHPNLIKEARKELAGKDLVCWCAPLPCHADILLELANKKEEL